MNDQQLSPEEFQAKIQILEEENSYLADRYQDYFLLGSVLESVSFAETAEDVLQIYLEKLCLILDFVYGAVFSFDGHQPVRLSVFSQIHDTSNQPIPIINPVLFNSDETIRFLTTENATEGLIEISPAISSNGTHFMIINLQNMMWGNTICIFCVDFDQLSKEKQQTVSRVSHIAKSKINNLYLLRQMQDMNQQLETLVEDQSEEISLFKNLFESSAESIIVFNEELHPLYFNNAFIKNWKAETADKNAIDLFSLFSSQDLDQFSEDRMKKVFNGQSIKGEINAVKFDGTVFQIWYRFQKIEAAFDKSYFALMAHSIALEKENELKYQNLVNHLSDGIYILYENKFEYINSKFTDITGYSLDDLTAGDFDLFSLFHPDSISMIKDRLEKRKLNKPVPSHYRFKIITKAGEVKHIEASVAYFPYKEGIATQGIVRDITQQMELEEQLHQSQKMESIGRLASGVAHDFNNILTVISGYSDMLTRIAKEKYPELVRRFEQINQAAEHAETLTRQLLAFSRKQRVEPQPIPLHSHLQKSQRILKRLITENIELSIQDVDEDLIIQMDPGQLDQVLINLVVNACDAMENGGQITISASGFAPEEVPEKVTKLLDDPSSELACIQIADTGSGIPESILPHIFEPFYTTKDKGKGTGLGLATVYGIIQQHDGCITVDSKTGQGTRFKLWMPIKQDYIPLLKESEKISVKGNHKTVMIVEDNDQVRELVTQILKQQDFKTISLESPFAALKYFNKTNHDDVHLLISDIIMPGMNGKELFLELSKKNPELKVLFMSGYTDDIINSEEIYANGWEFIQKPLKIQNLLKKIKSILN